MSGAIQQSIPKNDRLLLSIATLLGLAMISASFFLSWLTSRPFIQGTLHQGVFLPVCLFKHLTALPCPSCGLTRAMIQIAQGDVVEAMRYNLLSVPLFITTLLFVIASVTRPASALVILRTLGTLRAVIFMIAALLVAWVVKLTGSPLYW